MRARRLLLPALFLAAATIAGAPANAALPEPTWLTPEAVTAPGQLGSQDAVSTKMAAGGGVLAGWNHFDGSHSELRGRYRTTDGSWGAEATISGPGNDASDPSWIALENGDILVVWPENDGGWKIKSGTVDPTGQWTHPVVLSNPGSNASGADVAQDASGNTYLSYSSGEAYLRVRPAGSETWSDPEPIPGSHDTSESKTAVTPDGAVTVTWTTASTLYAASRAAGETNWSTPQAISATADQLGMSQLVADDNGRVAAAWVQMTSGVMTTHAAVRDALGTWGAAEQHGASSTFLPGLITNGSDIVNTWLTADSSYDAYSSDLGADADSWSLPALHLNSAGEFAANTGLTSRPDGSIYAAISHGTDLDHALPGSMGRSPSGTWGELRSATEDPIQVQAGGGIGSDDEGNLVIAWGNSDGAVMIGVGDGAGPVISGVSVPGSATVGQMVAVSASASDRFSDVDSTAWNFGDGGERVGASADHRYTAPGTYSVTVTATDSVGNDSAETRTISVAAPPTTPTPPAPPAPLAQPAPPKKTLAPVIEARLSGRTVTLNARVKLRQGRSCTGKAVATTRFGNRTYRTTLRLRTSGKTCRATGTIKLKKTPSTRTRLRVKINSSSLKTRTLSTKRA